MGIMKCEERSLENPQAKDAVWVPNGAQLYYPYVSSCVTVTLVFENGVLGGHQARSRRIKIAISVRRKTCRMLLAG